ncbi:MAG: helix-turn-helix transcriptional regulator [Akkermansiaceae bacterium]
MAVVNQWTFFSNHGHVLIFLSREPDVPLREVAIAVGITERAVQRIVADLEEAGYLTRERDGRRNVYTLNTDQRLRHTLEKNNSIGDVIAVLSKNNSK